MIKKEITIAGKRCFVFADEEPEVLLVEPMDLRDLDFLDKEIETLKAGTARPFALATLIIEDWNKELAPWASDPVFGKDPFGDGAPETLRLIEGNLIPEMEALFPTLKGAEKILGGYSLAALFALWCACGISLGLVSRLDGFRPDAHAPCREDLPEPGRQGVQV